MVIELEKIIKLENSNSEYYSLILSKINNFESRNDDVTSFLKKTQYNTINLIGLKHFCCLMICLVIC